jgi:hypothetical protein
MLFAYVGEAGNAILFVVTLLGWTLLAGYTLALSAHCYFVVVQGTVAGLDRVQWPDEPVYDWLLQALNLLGLAAIWLVPVGFLSKALAPHLLPGDPALRFLLLSGPGMWLFFPVTLLSSMGSVSRWQILNGRVIAGLFTLAPQVFLFYVLSAGVMAAAAALAYFGLFTAAWFALPIAAVLGSAAWLIHARLLGRVGWLLQERFNHAARTVRKQASRPSEKKRPRKARAVAVQDPWAVPDEDEKPAPPAKPGYRVVEVPPKKAPRPAYMDPEPEPYILADEPEPVAPQAPRLELNQAQVEREIELRTRKPPNPPPDYPLFSGVWTFPGYDTTQKAWVWLAFWGGATGFVTRGLIVLFPF